MSVNDRMTGMTESEILKWEIALGLKKNKKKIGKGNKGGQNNSMVSGPIAQLVRAPDS